MARSRAGEIGSAHSTQAPYSPSLSWSSAADRWFTRASSSSRVATDLPALTGLDLVNLVGEVAAGPLRRFV
jgi:hypothetical protein